MAWYVDWNRRIEPYAHLRVRVEDVTGDDLHDLVRYAGAFHAPWEISNLLGQVPTDVNTRPKAGLSWDDLPDGPLKDELAQMAKEYGYTVKAKVAA
jgi:hypothetical protein